MKIKTWIKYTEGFLPTPRCRKLRYKECEDFVEIELKEISKEDTQLAYVSDGFDIVRYNNNLYIEVTASNAFYCGNDERNTDNTIIGRLKHSFSGFSAYFGYGEEDSREKMIERAEKDMSRYLLIDNSVWQVVNRPVYVIHTFGLGNNHAGIGTSVSIEYTSKPVDNNNYFFEAYEKDVAIRKALSVATRRGDTDSVDFIKQVGNIEYFNMSNKQLVEELKIKGYTCTNYSDNAQGQSVSYYEDKDNVLKITSEWVKVGDNHYTTGNVISVEDVTECYK